MTPRRRKPARWSFTAGEHPYSVRVFEREPGGVLYVKAWNRATKRQERYSLGHRDQERAIAQAESTAKRLRDGADVAVSAPATVGYVLREYLASRAHKGKVPSSRAADERQAELWKRFLGADRKIATLGSREWHDFIAKRSTGSIDARGRTPEQAAREEQAERRARATERNADRKARYEAAIARQRGGGRGGPRSAPTYEDVNAIVIFPKLAGAGPRTVDADLVFLVAVFNWACDWRSADGRPLLERNPWGAQGFGVKRRTLARPKNRAPKQPVATYDRYLAVRAAAEKITMRVRRAGKSTVQRSYLAELLELVEQTGRRITAVCRLRYDDILRAGGEITAIRWRPIKKEDESVVTVSDETRATLERILRERPGIGASYLFPSPASAERPVSRHVASDWLVAAELLAGIPHLDRGAWHPYRRKWGTERKHHPTADVMKAGGWKDERSLKTSYQKSDEATVLAVVNEPRKLREKKA